MFDFRCIQFRVCRFIDFQFIFGMCSISLGLGLHSLVDVLIAGVYLLMNLRRLQLSIASGSNVLGKMILFHSWGQFPTFFPTAVCQRTQTARNPSPGGADTSRLTGK